jgi:phage/plasmid-associated DNA primase
MTVELKKTLIETMTSKDEMGKVLSVFETKYTNYSYFTLSIEAKKNDKGELKKICQFPKDWPNIDKKFNPKHNGIALICGQKSGLYVVDYDDQTSFLKDALKHPELENHYLKTRKGYHSYFKWTPEVQKRLGSTSIKEKNIDFQGDKKCVFTEPTKYKDDTGNEYNYKFLHEEPLQEMSEDLINFFLINYFKKPSKLDEEKVIENTQIVSINDKKLVLTPILNEMLGVDFKWDCEKVDEDSYKLTHDSLVCLKTANTSHSGVNHSCLYINKRVATITCFSCKNKKLLIREYPKLKEIKTILGLTAQKKTSEEETNNDFETLMYFMLEHAESKLYKKENGWILRPVEGIPTHYEDYLEYSEFLDEIFQDKELTTYRIFRKKVAHKHQLLDYLKTYNDNELPFIKRDPYIYSFNNGYFNLKTLEFLNFEAKQYDFCGGVFIKEDFDIQNLTIPFNKIKTPLFDKLIKYHVNNEEVYNIILCLLGRLFYGTGELDNWQCMLFIKGQGNTGKSTLINIIENLFSTRMKGTINSTLEKTFGLQTLYNKRIVISPDIPVKLSERLDATTLQSMISGESVSVAVKNGEARDVIWKPQLLFAGNFLPDYCDKSGSVSRRLAIVDMGKKVINKEASLKTKILTEELGLLLVKFVKAYAFYIKKFGEIVFEDWGKKFNIDYFDKAREEFKQESDILYAFLTASPGTNETKSSNIWIEHKEGEITPLENLKKTFKTYAKIKHNNQNYKWSNTSDNSTLEALGYDIITLNICASCGKKAQKGCCDNYSTSNRRKKVVIKHMVIRNGFEEDIDFEEPDHIY